MGVWAKFRELPLRKKGNGRSIMVSEFLMEECGRLKLNSQQRQQNPSIPEEARAYLQSEKDREGYWTSEHLIEQVKTKAIPILKQFFQTVLPCLRSIIVRTTRHIDLMHSWQVG